MKLNNFSNKKELFYSAKASKKELFYNDIADVWEDKINNFETSIRLRIVFKVLLEQLHLKNKKFLEVGCGMGYFSEEAYKLGAKVTGVDIGNKLVNMTSKRVPKGKFLTASAATLPFRDNQFDVVLSTEVLEHVENQEGLLLEVYRVSKKGGIFVITTPNKIYKPIFDFLGFIGLRPYHGNENWLGVNELRTMLKKTGFRLKKSISFNLFINQGHLCTKK